MPVAVRCPSCHAPMPEAPDAGGIKCAYCGTLVQATQFMPAPVLAPPPVMAPPPENPFGAGAGAEPWRSPGAPTVARRSGLARFLVVFFVMDALIGAGVAVFFLTRSGSGTFSSSTTTSSGTSAAPAGPLVLPAATLEPGTPLDIDVPDHGGGPTSIDLAFAVPAAAPWEAWMGAENVSRSCTMSVLGAGDAVLAGPLHDSHQVWSWLNLPAGPGTIHVECESSPIPQHLRVQAGPLARWDGRNPLRVAVADGTPAVGVVVPLDREGFWSVSYDGSGMGPYRLLGADGAVLGTGSTSSSGVAEHRLPAGELVAHFAGSGSGSGAGQLTLVRSGPEPLVLGETVVHVPTAQAPSTHFSLRLDAPLRLAVTVVTRGGGADIRVSDAGGVEVAGARGSSGDSAPSAGAAGELPAGVYDVAILSNQETEFRVWAHEAGELRVLAAEERAEYQALRGCSCRADVDGQPGDDLLQLSALVTGTIFEMMSQARIFDLAWALDAGALGALELAGDDVAPPARVGGSSVGVALACTDDAVVVAGLDRVTAWSVATRRMLWSTSFAGTYPPGSGGSGGDLGINCGRLTIRNGVVSVPLAGGGKANVRLADGVVQP
ncbi:MAG: hypothetical protein HY907_16470 [Deltaproteobacteria bacterium]|nr:hypothetical protein [Deltaproteobacteria bacterium]